MYLYEGIMLSKLKISVVVLQFMLFASCNLQPLRAANLEGENALDKNSVDCCPKAELLKAVKEYTFLMEKFSLFSQDYKDLCSLLEPKLFDGCSSGFSPSHVIHKATSEARKEIWMISDVRERLKSLMTTKELDKLDQSKGWIVPKDFDDFEFKLGISRTKHLSE
jgi:hypothetical protein